MRHSSENRPVLKIVLTKFDYALELAALLGILFTWIVPLIIFRQLPDTIPTHFGLDGKVDDWGSKITIFIVPVISFLLVIGMSILNKFPHIFNYPIKLTDENALQLYSKATRMLRVIKLIVVLLFSWIEWQICNISDNSRLPVWFLPLVIIIPIVLPVVMAFTLTNKPFSGKREK